MKRPGRRHIVFRKDWLAMWEVDPGLELEVQELARGGFVVRPRGL